MLDKGKFLSIFLKRFPTFPHRMRSCLHSYSSENLSPYHLEDDCWSHTMMVYESIKIHDFTENEEYKVIACLISALCHDAGKQFTRESHKPGRINFGGHEYAGVQFAIDVCFDLFYKAEIKDSCSELFLNRKYFKDILEIVVYCVSAHNSLDELYLPEQFISFLNQNKDLGDVLLRLRNADIQGQISIDLYSRISKLETAERLRNSIIHFKEKEQDNYGEVILFCGIPGVGKDFYGNGYSEMFGSNFEVLTYDKCRVEYFISKHPKIKNHMNDLEIYSEAYKTCTDEIALNLIGEKIIERVNKNEFPIIISNTYTTFKTRSKIIKLIQNKIKRNIKISCVYILSPLNQAIDLDFNRKDHIVGKDVIMKFAMHQELPSMSEGFISVDFIPNIII